MPWKLEQHYTSSDGWWLRSATPGELGSRIKPFEDEHDALLAAKEGEHPQFVRRDVPVHVWVDEQTGAVHTAELDEGGDPIEPGDEVEPLGAKDLSIPPTIARDQLQHEVAAHARRLAELEAE